MASTSNLVAVYMASGPSPEPSSSSSTSNAAASNVPGELAKAIASKPPTRSLIELVKCLGEFLTSEEDDVRKKGVGLLAAVLTKLGKDQVNRQETKTLTDFLISKISDPHSLQPALQGINSLVSMSNFGLGEAKQVVEAIFENVDMKSLGQGVRFEVFRVFDKIMGLHRRALKRMGPSFVNSYCTKIAEGEKDPRNLMIAFSLARVLGVEFDLGEYVEALFDVTFCYFPITFKPPPDDPYGISSEDLQVKLRECLASTPRFGPLAVPLFLDKLQATTSSAKRQSLQAIRDCMPVYGAAVIRGFETVLWESLNVEIFHPIEAEIEQCAQDALRSFLSTLYPDEEISAIREEAAALDSIQEDEEVAAAGEEGQESHTHDDPHTERNGTAGEGANGVVKKVIGVATKILDLCLDELNEPDKSNAKPATRILATCVSASDTLAEYTLSRAIPHLLSMYKNTDEISRRPSCLVALSELIKSVRTSPPSRSLSPSLASSRDELLGVFTSGCRTRTSRAEGLQGLVELVMIRGYLDQTETGFAVRTLNEMLLDEDAGDVSDAALDGLVSISFIHPKTTEEAVLPSLFSQLPDRPPGTSDSEGSRKTREALAALASLCLHPNLFETLVVTLLSRLELLCSHQYDTATTQTEPAADAASSSSFTRRSAVVYAHQLFLTLRTVIQSKIKAGHEDLPKYQDRLFPRLFGIFILPTLDEMDRGLISNDELLLGDAAKVVTTMTQKLDLQQQVRFASALRAAFYEGNLVDLIGNAARHPNGDAPFRPFEAGASARQANTVALFAAGRLAMRIEAVTDSGSIVPLDKTTIDRTLTISSEFQHRMELHMIASRLNKRLESLSEFVDRDLPAFWDESIASTSTPLDKRKKALQTWAYVTKALIVRSDARGYASLLKVVELFSDEEVGKDAAMSLGIIADESDGVLSKDNFAVIRFLYKQRFFSTILTRLVSGYQSSNGPVQEVFLVGLASLLPHIPNQIAVTEFPKFIPLLLRAFDLSDLNLRTNVIEAFVLLSNESASVITDHASTLVTLLLRNAIKHKAGAPGIQTRIASLRCLAVFPSKVRYDILHPQKATVLRELGKAVDDPKKTVRREAVDTRAKWFLYNG